MSRIFIISNRLPVNVTLEAGEIQVNQSSGGLVSAMKSYIDFAKGKGIDPYPEKYWVGVPGCTQGTWEDAKSKLQGDYDFLPVFINKSIYDNYYNGLSNSVIWPLFHYFPSYADYNPEFFADYMRANEEFLHVLVPKLRENDVVWIHDYHLLPLAKMIRKQFPNITIGFFLHIPFPSYELFRLMPNAWQEEMLHGMMGADLIGFHTIDYATHFLKCIQMNFGLDSERGTLKYDNRLIKTDVFPISIDYNKFQNCFTDKLVQERRAFYKEKFSGTKIIFSVDRLDYTKCVLCRLKGYERFLSVFPQYKEKVVFILSVIPSRDNIPSYIKRKKEIDEFIGSFNASMGSITWKPVIYQYDHLDFVEMIALYTAADLALITPLRDGMNLVAKEFVASRKDQKGVLVLSEMAGAAKELTDAIIINPNDTNAIALKIRDGLQMPEEEQQVRMARMQTRLEQYNVATWADDFLDQLKKIKKRQKDFDFIFLDYPSRLKLVEAYRNSSNRLLLLDYDGTLVPFSSLPGQSNPGPALLDVLDKLSTDKKNAIYIISGRDSNTLEKWLGHLQVNLIAEHGAKMRRISGPWLLDTTLNIDEGWKDRVHSVMQSYVTRCANTFTEKKDFSLVWHYRNADRDQGILRASELFSELSAYSNELNIQVMQGNKIIEARVKGMDKGFVTRKLIKEDDFDFILSCGDDSTDEDMFKVLIKNKKAYTIKIGDTASYAKYNIFTPQMTVSLLELLSKT